MMFKIRRKKQDCLICFYRASRRDDGDETKFTIGNEYSDEKTPSSFAEAAENRVTVSAKNDKLMKFQEAQFRLQHRRRLASTIRHFISCPEDYVLMSQAEWRNGASG
jgi:hypothetical protein